MSPEKFIIARVEARASAGKQVAAMRIASLLINWTSLCLLVAMVRQTVLVHLVNCSPGELA